MEIKSKDISPEVEHELTYSQEGDHNREKSGLTPKLVLGCSIALGLVLSSFIFFSKSPVRDANQPILAKTKIEKVISSYSYEQFPISKVKRISAKVDLPVKLKNMNPILLQDLINNKSELRVIKIYDFLENDGDVVEITINNNRLGFYDLTNTEQKISVPFYKNVPTLIKVKAVDDGGGGVTFGMKGTQGEFKTKVMQLGETFSWEFSK